MSEDRKISLEEVEHIAELARIKLTKKEKEEFSEELSDVLRYIEQLQEVNTDGIEPVSQVTGLVNVLREDVVENCAKDDKKKIIESFPEEKDGHVKVKQVM
ncbi:Asp-tRNA(Asn)/Glu-tRNA(Gln) amidotransferase subunit GatC [Candidatus Parcubacteria bacterium]|nr:Asp-tRNA(Asn)/Glu-tRNA(Gln) amidotransferase subunit GatC [Candidatus Parcubacteria bacterium]